MDDLFNSPGPLVAEFEAGARLGLEHEGQVSGRPILLYFDGKFIRTVGTSFEAALKHIRASSSDRLKKYAFLSNVSLDNSSKLSFL